MAMNFTTPSVINIGALAANQLDARTVALPDGGFVTFWEDDATAFTTIRMQRFDGAGNPVGTVQTALSVAGEDVELHGVTVSSDGRIWIAASDTQQTNFEQDVFLRAFNPTTLASTGIFVSTLPGELDSADIVASDSAPGGVALWTSRMNSGVNTVGVQIISPTGAIGILQPAGSGGALPAPIMRALSDTTVLAGDNVGLLNTNAQSVVDVEVGTDAVRFQGDSYLVLQAMPFASPNVGITVVTAPGGDLANSTVSVATQITSASGLTTAGAGTFDSTMIDLGGGRYLIAWVADGGDSFQGTSPLTDGVYAQVFNINTGSVEGSATLIQSFGTGSNDAGLSSITLSATEMADGRVSLAFAFSNGLFMADGYFSIIDARNGPISVEASSAADHFVGTGSADIFSGVSNGDSIFGGSGLDTVIFKGTSDRLVDLAQAAAFPESTFVLDSIENVTGGSGNDQIYGSAVVNVLTGGIGNDLIDGRAGADVLRGDAGNDILRGGAGTDVMDGGNGADTLLGEADGDVMQGNAGADLLQGGSGDDTIRGGADGDRLFGQAGADDLFGDDGDDLLDGGAGDDLLSGGAGNDTLRARGDADSLFGGDGNDLIQVDTDAVLIDGGAGIDTLVLFADTELPEAPGVQVDLSNTLDLFGFADTFDTFTATFSGVENLTGTVSSDFLAGSEAANLLRGGTGGDILVGRGGADTLFGGAGADTFVFADTTGGNDQIRDFAVGVDKIALVGDGFGDLASVGLATRLTLNTTGLAAANANAQLILDTGGTGAGRLFFDADGNGAGAAVLVATLTTTPALGLADITAADFIFI